MKKIILVVSLLILFLLVFFYNQNNKDVVFKSEFLDTQQQEFLPSSFMISGDMEVLTPPFNPKINRYLINSNKYNEEFNFNFSVGENYKILSETNLKVKNNKFEEYVVEIVEINTNKKYYFSIVTTNEYFPNYEIEIINVNNVLDGNIYTTFKNFRNYTFLEAVSLIDEFSFSEFQNWFQRRKNKPQGPVFEQTQKYIKNKNAKSNALILDKFGVPLVVIQGNSSFADFKYFNGIGYVLGVYGVPPAGGVLVGKYKVYDEDFNNISEILWSNGGYLDVHDLDYDIYSKNILKIGYSQYIPGVSTITETIWSSSYIVENSGVTINQWDAFLSFPLGYSQDTFIDTQNWDVFHINSARIYGDNILVSLRHTNSISLIDNEGNEIWSIANNNKINDFEIYEDPFGIFYGQHDARIVDGNYLTLFDNQNNQGKVARGVVYLLDSDLKTATFQKHYLLEDEALCCGSFQLLENGSVLSGGSDGTIFEFHNSSDSANLKIEIGGIVYRAIKQKDS